MTDEVTKADVFDLPFQSPDIIDAADVDLSKLDDDEAALIEMLATNHPARQIRLYGTDPLHAKFIDKSKESVENSALLTIQKAGCFITQSGLSKPRTIHVEHEEDIGTHKTASVEFKPRDYVLEMMGDRDHPQVITGP